MSEWAPVRPLAGLARFERRSLSAQAGRAAAAALLGGDVNAKLNDDGCGDRSPLWRQSAFAAVADRDGIDAMPNTRTRVHIGYGIDSC